jgi:signal transduction histidine kinase/CHASE3 domain sensor protein/CheY-like chemotaxis protein
LTLGFIAVVLLFVLSGALSYANLRRIMADVDQMARTHNSLAKLDEFLSLMKDAETGQRGFVVTEDPRYLEPYHLALSRIGTSLREVEQFLDEASAQRDKIPELRKSIEAKLAELGDVIRIRQSDGFEAARAAIATDRGKELMDGIRQHVRQINEVEQRVRDERLAEMSGAFNVAVGSGLAGTILGVALSGTFGLLVRRAALSQQRRDWLQKGTVGLGAALAGNQQPRQIGENALKFLAEYLDAHAGAFFVKSGSGFERVATYGVPSESDLPTSVNADDGLLWQAARDRRTFVLTDVPDGYLTIGSGLGRTKPRHLIVAPATVEDEVMALLELGYLRSEANLSSDLLKNASEFIGRAVKAANYRAHLQSLIEETQRQAEELQVQSEELRVSNEELEEQGRALRESQSRLELQQAELEQTNAQLEEHTELLENQRDDLSRTKADLAARAQELERASRYKSDFLANMSHELRTPLNSTLILAKLLADNAQGNLTEEQIRYAQTIRSAGIDLLNLINDILDLSKIEAGHMEVQPEEVPLSRLVESLRNVFEPLAMQKGLELRTSIAPRCPDAIETDRLRLEQVLKNLLSNAIKFTEAGSVSLDVSQVDGRLAISVTDTGIGIPREQQSVVFEAFRQADGTTNRKYGGTGLGLSIGRELTRLLGGELNLTSEPGRGSIFTVVLPLAYSPVTVPRQPLAATVATAAEEEADLPIRPNGARLESGRELAAATMRGMRPHAIEDDRERLSGDRRVLLVVEDDEPFARILSDLAHELDFQCLIASTAGEATTMAAQYLPSAVVLDVSLPDHSGLTVLDRLKHDARTRHIPVHVVSALDHSESAMSLGAVGYWSSRSTARTWPAHSARSSRDSSGGCAASFWSRTMPSSSRAWANSSVRRTSRPSACPPPPSASSGFTPRRSIAWCWTSPCRTPRDTRCSKRSAVKTGTPSHRSLCTLVGSCRPTRSSGSVAIRNQSSSRARSRPNGCWTR